MRRSLTRPGSPDTGDVELLTEVQPSSLALVRVVIESEEFRTQIPLALM